MNEGHDCAYYIIFACEGYDGCECQCERWNDQTKNYQNIIENYQKDVDKALEPVYEKYRILFENGDI